MVNEVIYFIPPFFGLVLIGMGITYRQYILGMMGATMIFLYGVAILISPIVGITSLMNDVLGTVSFGAGLGIILIANNDLIEEALPV